MIAVLFDHPARDVWEQNLQKTFFDDFTGYPKRYNDLEKLAINVIYDVVCNSSMIDRLVIRRKSRTIQKSEAEFDQQNMTIVEHTKEEQVYFLERLDTGSKEYKKKALDQAIDLFEWIKNGKRTPQEVWDAIKENEYPQDHLQYIEPLREQWFTILSNLHARGVYAYQLDIMELERFLDEYPRALIL